VSNPMRSFLAKPCCCRFSHFWCDDGECGVSHSACGTDIIVLTWCLIGVGRTGRSERRSGSLIGLSGSSEEWRSFPLVLAMSSVSKCVQVGMGLEWRLGCQDGASGVVKAALIAAC
jgi:hypothetical protein